MISSYGAPPMTDEIKLPRRLSEEPNAPKPLRPSHQKIIENLDRWANSSANFSRRTWP